MPVAMTDLDRKPSHDLKEDASVDLEGQGGGGIPHCLRDLSTEEYTKIGRRATMKMDFVLLPCLMVMYIL